MQSRDYYWLLNRGDTKATGLIKWEKDLQLVDFKWENYFNSIKTLYNETKLRDFYYKFLHRIVTTKRELIQKVETTAIMSKSLKTIPLSLIFQTCFDGTSVIVSVTVKITSVWLHNIAITSIRT